MFKNPPTGKFSVDCHIHRQEWSSNKVPVWTIVDSGSLTVLEAKVIQTEAGEYAVDIQLQRELEPFEVSRLTCFCRVADGDLKDTRPMVATKVDEEEHSLIHCGKIPFPGGNEYECGAVLNADTKVLR